MPFKYGDKIRVVKGVHSSGALMPAVGVEGHVVRDRTDGLISCEFMPPFPLHGGGKALEDDNHPEGVRVYFKTDEIEKI